MQHDDPTPSSAIPSPRGRGLMGHQPEYAADPLGTFRRWTAVLGDAVRLRFGPVRALLLTSPGAVEDVLVREEGAFRKAPVVRRLASRVIGDSMFTAEGEEWRRQRVLLEGFFTPQRIEAHVPVIAAEMEAMVGRWSEDGVAEALAETMAASQRIAGRVLFGVDTSEADVVAAARALATTAADFQHGIDHPLSSLVPEWISTAARRRRRHAVAELDRLVERIIAQRRDAPDDDADLLGELLRRREDLPWLTDRLIRDNVLTLLTESREDPALLLTWALYLLSRHPDEQELVAREVADVVPGPVPRAGDLRGLQRSAAVLREALRLYPPVYGTGREAVRDCAVAGIAVKRGTIVLLSQDVMHHQARWFPEPDAFRPARWLEHPESTLPKGVFTPFNIGPRRCLGERLAWTIALVGLAVILRSRRCAPADPHPVEPTVLLSLRPSREVMLRITPR